MLPFRLEPVFKNYLWGGEKLITSWGKNPPSRPLAESWELAAHVDGDNVIIDGELKGLTLSEAVRRNPKLVAAGRSATPTQNFDPENIFPLMVKLIDSAKPLSIQVHPDDAYAAAVEHSKGKTELWYILDHEPGAFLYLGFKEKITHREFERAIETDNLLNVLRKIEVHKGDSFFIPAGTVHSIGAGITLVEIQENSNITYRVYDYGRVGVDGKPRELHIAKALDVVQTRPASLEIPGSSEDFIARCAQFSVRKIKVAGSFVGTRDFTSFRFLLCLSGRVSFRCGGFECEISRGENIFVPPALPVSQRANCEENFHIDGEGEILVVRSEG